MFWVFKLCFCKCNTIYDCGSQSLGQDSIIIIVVSLHSFMDLVKWIQSLSWEQDLVASLTHIPILIYP